MRIILISCMAFIFSVSAFAAEKDPIQIIVNLKKQHLKVYQGTEQIAQSNISSGKQGHRSPTGVFSVLQKNRKHYSNLYNNAPMPFMQRLTWSGIAMHSSNHVPRYPASHGCIRMPWNFAKKLFKYNTRGVHVIIEDETREPSLISHSSLFQPTKSWEINNVSDKWLKKHVSVLNGGYITARKDLPIRIFITRRGTGGEPVEVQRLLDKLGYDVGEIDGLIGPQSLAAIKEFKAIYGLEYNERLDETFLEALYQANSEQKPANGRLMVRQRHKPVFSADITINNAQMALGSHLLTVSNFDADEGKTDWVAVSLNDRIQKKVVLDDETVDWSSGRRELQNVLSRISMGEEVREQISRLLTPGSSITISDNGFSAETHREKGTDFIVLTKPQNDNNVQAKNKIKNNNG